MKFMEGDANIKHGMYMVDNEVRKVILKCKKRRKKIGEVEKKSITSYQQHCYQVVCDFLRTFKCDSFLRFSGDHVHQLIFLCCHIVNHCSGVVVSFFFQLE